jgi:histidyl-tRNA synthetase
LISLAIHLLRGFGLTERDFSVRLCNRNLWSDFLERHNVPTDRTPEFLGIIDKLGREEEGRLAEKLAAFSLNLEQIQAFLATPTEQLPGFEALFRELQWRGIADFCELDLTIVRGLDYYSGLVFELFDRRQENRAIAGGGRYDKLIEVISDGSVDLPAAGFAIGDVVLRNFLEELPHTQALAAERMAKRALRGYIVIASEPRRTEAIKLATRLRQAGISVDFPLEPAKVAKQFQTAESLGAQYAVVVGQEWPQIRLKNLRTRGESVVLETELETNLKLEN